MFILSQPSFTHLRTLVILRILIDTVVKLLQLSIVYVVVGLVVFATLTFANLMVTHLSFVVKFVIVDYATCGLRVCEY